MTLYNCDKCGKDIGLNEGYVSITYNVEMLKKDMKTLQDHIVVAQSDLVMVLCGRCGNQHQASAMGEALKLKNRSVDLPKMLPS